MNAEQLAVTDLILNSAAEAATDDLVLLQEGAMKIAILRRLLDSGYSIREGSPRSSEDWLITRSPQAKRLTTRIATRSRRSGNTKPDIRVESPTMLRAELKVFGEFGSKDTFNRGEIYNQSGKPKNYNSFLWDLQALEDGNADLAIVTASARCYDTARNQRWSNRGSPAEVCLDGLLPARDTLKKDEAKDTTPVFREHQWKVRSILAPAPAIDEYSKSGDLRRQPESRVVVGIWLD